MKARQLREQLVRLLVPELADLRQQLDQARRLAGEAQGRFREAARVRDQLASALSNRDDEAVADAFKIDRLTADLARVKAELAGIKADIDKRHGPLLGPIAMERDQLRARVVELEVDKKRSEAAWDAKPFFQGDKNP